MKRVPILPFLYVSVFAFLLSSCGTSNRFASSFGKRKYTKGYYADRIGHAQKPVAMAGTQHQTHIYPTPGKPAATTINTAQMVVVTAHHAIPPTPKPSFAHSLKAATAHLYHVQKPVIASDTSNAEGASSKGETNYFAISGFVLSTVGVVMCIANEFFVIGAIVLLLIGGLLCIYSLCLDKIYWSWLGIVGLALILFLFTLILL